ncbi:hypothetical protein [Burkholderia stagnalis]|uniref:phage adaptor protein n=1 Tax=Burkholderia stagnalis TaxID=1503054 RepID=UPI00325C28DE
MQITAKDLIMQALKEIGVVAQGQPATDEDIADCLFRLNGMLGQWEKKRALVYRLRSIDWQADGSTSYKLGPGAEIDTPRPSKIASGYVRLLGGSMPVDYQLTVIVAREDYDRIAVKELRSMPSFVYLDTTNPAATLYLWPVPTSQYRVHVTAYEVLPRFDDAAEPIDLPDVYQEALFYNAVVRFSPMYRLPVTAEAAALARAALDTITGDLLQIPLLQMPDGLARRGRYSIYSDRVQ